MSERFAVTATDGSEDAKALYTTHLAKKKKKNSLAIAAAEWKPSECVVALEFENVDSGYTHLNVNRV